LTNKNKSGIINTENEREEKNMVVYAVRAVVDEEYGCREVQRIYSSREGAEEYVSEHQEYFQPWWADDDAEEPVYDVVEMEVH
jgi:uncharacterized protein YfcZ (UPF0381/DUF406 family)